MVSRCNSNAHPLNLQSEDYVFVSEEPTGQGQKLQHKFDGPYVVHRLSSPHMVILKDPDTNICRKDAVHMDRLKMAFIREPSPKPYFLDTVPTHKQTEFPLMNAEAEHQQNHMDTPEILDDYSSPKPTPSPPITARPKRIIRKPVRYRDFSGLSEDIVSSSDSSCRYKIKRIVGQRKYDKEVQYKVILCGEPSNKSFWVARKDLDAKALKCIDQNPPPVLS